MNPLTASQRLADRFLQERRIAPELRERAHKHAMASRKRLEDAILELELASEADLLRYVSAGHKTKFVSTEKLFKASVDPTIVGLVPAKLAELHNVMPVLYQGATDSLSVVTADPDDIDALKEIRMAASVKTVQPLLARPAAIRASIRRAYFADPAAFEPLMPAIQKAQAASAASAAFAGRATTGSNPFAAGLPASSEADDAPTQARDLSLGSIPLATGPQEMYSFSGVTHFQRAHAPGGPAVAPAPAPAPMPARPQQPSQPNLGHAMPAAGAMPHAGALHGMPQPIVPQQHAAPQVAQRQHAMPAQQAQHVMPAQQAPHALAAQPAPAMQRPAAPAQQGAVQLQPSVARQPPPPPIRTPSTPSLDDEPSTSIRDPMVPFATLIDVTRALVDAVDAQRSHFEGHSTLVAGTMRKLCLALKIPEQRSMNYELAALLHDLGKDGAYHITALNVARTEACRAEAKSTVDVPRAFFPDSKIPRDTKNALRGMYERWDGRGLPKGVAGDAIDVGARLLGLCDSYADLVTHWDNPAGRKLDPVAAIAFLRAQAGSIFDPSLVEALRADVGAMNPGALKERPRVLVIDPDFSFTAPVAIGLIDQGFDVRAVGEAERALKELQAVTPIAVLCEADLEAPEAGLQLRGRVLGASWGRACPTWVLSTKRSDPQVEQMAFDLQFDDLVNKPARAEEVVARLKKIVDQKARG